MRPLTPRIVRRRRSAFTLIELLLVLVILGVLAAIVIPKVMGRDEWARKQAAKPSVEGVASAINQFNLDAKRYPTNEEGLQALIVQPQDVQDWSGGPYIPASKLKDPWQRDFNYVIPGVHNPNGFDVYSSGPDGIKDTEDDIGNW